MARKLRIDVPDAVYHVFSRAPNKSPLFRDDEDRELFLRYFKRAQNRYPLECLGYSLMTTHYHLQVKTLESPLARTLHNLNTLYAGHFNYRYKSVGHVFQGRFHSIPVQIDSYLLNLSRYIHLNAVAAGMVSKPEEHLWSSYREYLGMTSTGLVQVDLVLTTLSDNKERQRLTYQKFVEDQIHRTPQFSEDIIWKARVFGNAAFVERLALQCPSAFPARQDNREAANQF
jgi:putative transposase